MSVRFSQIAIGYGDSNEPFAPGTRVNPDMINAEDLAWSLLTPDAAPPDLPPGFKVTVSKDVSQPVAVRPDGIVASAEVVDELFGSIWRRRSVRARTAPAVVGAPEHAPHTLQKTRNRNEIERNTAVATHVNRFVVGPNAENRSAVLQRGLTNVQSREGFYWRATLWATQESPVDNTSEATGRRRRVWAHARTLPQRIDLPRIGNPARRSRRRRARPRVCRTEQEVHQKHLPSRPTGTSPTMHRTDTLDCLTCVRGEIYLVTDTDEVLMQPGDTVIVRGVNHAWSNRSNEPCLLVGTMTDAIPLG